MNTRGRKAGFTLVELVVVVVIVGIIASIAIPRISRGSRAAKDSATAADLHVLRTAILQYAAEHGDVFPGPTSDKFTAQLTDYSDAQGGTSQKRTGDYIYGPYILDIPPCPIGLNPGSNLVGIDTTNSPPATQINGGAGWVYNPNTGEIRPNAPDWVDAQGTVDGQTSKQ